MLEFFRLFLWFNNKIIRFKPHRHEGKVLGLAAYGNPKVAYNEMAKMIIVNDKTQNFMSHPENGLYLPLFENVKLKNF